MFKTVWSEDTLSWEVHQNNKPVQHNNYPLYFANALVARRFVADATDMGVRAALKMRRLPVGDWPVCCED
jgi:hypothetical protein